MILEAAAYAEGKITRPPKELEFANYIDKFGSPWGGGWMEWPAGLAGKVMTAQAYARAFQLYRSHGRSTEWINANPQVFELVTKIWRWRKTAGLHFTG